MRRVSISALGYYPNMLDPNPEVSKAGVRRISKGLAAAPKLGLKHVNGFVGRDWTKTVDENWPRFLKIWKPSSSLRRIMMWRSASRIARKCPSPRDEWPGGKNLLHYSGDLAGVRSVISIPDTSD